MTMPSRYDFAALFTVGLLSTRQTWSLVVPRGDFFLPFCNHIHSRRSSWQLESSESHSHRRSQRIPSELALLRKERARDAPITIVSSDDSSIDKEDGEMNGRGEDEVLWQDDRGNALCRICASADGEIPTSKHLLPQYLAESDLLGKIDAIYHASSHAETCSLKYLDTGEKGGGKGDGSDVEDRYDEEEELRLVSILRTSLEDAGFERLRRRDLDLCEALNAGYLLRLSIRPDVKSLDPCVGQEFFPEKSTPDSDDGGNEVDTKSVEQLLFDGRVLVFRRGYSEEVTKGRLLLPKVDYLQANLVQRSAAAVTSGLGRIERKIVMKVAQGAAAFRRSVRVILSEVADAIPVEKVSDFAKSKWGWKYDGDDEGSDVSGYDERENKVLKLGRYGGSKTQFVTSPDLKDALNPFLICEVDYDTLRTTNGTGPDVDHDIYEVLNTGQLTCEYDAGNSTKRPIELLKRVSISNLVDFFSPQGRKGIIRGFIEKAKLVEPTYQEVVVVWRPLPQRIKTKITLPQFWYDAAEIFGFDDRLPEKPKKLPEPKPSPLKIRAFTDVPMANLLAVLPKTKLVFRPADAVVFDTVSVFSLIAVLASQRFDNPKFDVIAIVSVTLWVIRTFFRYSNKLARYDLLVNKFLTSKIAHRGPGALKYLATEAGSQRATRAGLLYTWLREFSAGSMDNHSTEEEGSADGTTLALSRKEILQQGSSGMNSLLCCDRPVKLDVSAALDDLEELGAVTFSADGEMIKEIKAEGHFRQALKGKWLAVF